MLQDQLAHHQEAMLDQSAHAAALRVELEEQSQELAALMERVLASEAREVTPPPPPSPSPFQLSPSMFPCNPSNMAPLTLWKPADLCFGA